MDVVIRNADVIDGTGALRFRAEIGIRHGGGTGLGLPISKSIIEAHGGTMSIESELGSGTTFLITIPI